jgi:hypothetical protein
MAENDLSDPAKLAQDALYARDAAVASAAKLQKELDDLRGKLPSKEQLDRFAQLEAAASKADEDAKKQAGQWDQLRTDLTKKHDEAIAQRESRLGSLQTYITDLLVKQAFASAYDEKTPWFGGDDAKTVLSHELAAAAFRGDVDVKAVEQDGRVTFEIGVKHPHTGRVILGQDGKPAPFATAIGEYLQARPDKDRILRGSGKTGSGSSGGANTGPSQGPLDATTLTPAQLRDPAILKQLRDEQPSGGISFGRAWNG